MYKVFLCLRYLRKRRIAFFAIMAVCLCSFMVLVVVSVMGGFLDMVKQRSRGLLGDLVMENGYLQGFPYYQEFIDTLKTEMGDRIVEATPVIVNYGLLRYPDENSTKAVQVVGIRLEETYRVNEFRKSLNMERFYPGTTALTTRPAPVVGLDESSQLRLPLEYEAAYSKWLASAGPRDKADAEKQVLGRVPRPGRFGIGRTFADAEVKEAQTVPFRSSLGSPASEVPIDEALPGWACSPEPGLIPGIDVCAERQRDGSYRRVFPVGYKALLTLLPLTPKGTLAGGGASAPTIACRMVDDSCTGIYDIDSLSVYADFDLVQNALLMGPQSREGGAKTTARTTQIQIKLKAGEDPDVMCEAIAKRWGSFIANIETDPVDQDLLSGVKVRTWLQKQAKFIAAVEKEKMLVTILFGIISLVAVLLVGCIFYMIAQQKTRDVGIIKSVGATRLGVAWIFLAYGAAVGIVGGAVGLAGGGVFVHHINDVQDLLTRINPQLQVWSPEVYSFSRIPNEVKLSDIWRIYLVAILASMAGSLIGAFKAARVWPVEALRYE